MVRRPAAAKLAAAAWAFAALFESMGATGEAHNLLENPSFEASGNAIAGWYPGGSAILVPTSAPSVDGSAARLEAGGPALVSQTVPVSTFGTYEFSIHLAAERSGCVEAQLKVWFLNAGFEVVSSSPSTGWRSLPSAFTALSVEGRSHSSTAYVTVEIQTRGSATCQGQYVVFLDEASLTVTSAPTPTPTATPTMPPPPPTATPTMPPPPATPSRTPTPTRPPSATATPHPTQTPTPVPTRTSIVPSPTATPTPNQVATTTPSPPPFPIGGLLTNGGFEDVREGQPVAWWKYGGELSETTESYSGAWAARFASTTSSTKWVYQVVAIEGGEWYAASVMSRVEGPGEAFVRVSWYATLDGSGTALGYVDGRSTSSQQWTAVGTGPVRAPEAAQSARVRLMLRPASAALTIAWFDDAWFIVTPERPTPEPTAPAEGPIDGPRAATSPTPRTSPTPGSATAPRRPNGGPSEQPTSAVAGARTSGSESVKLSEILSDPDVAEASNDHEWVELYNHGPTAVELEGWGIGDARSVVTLPPYRLESGAYVVVAGAKAQLPEGVPVLRLRGRIGNGLNNSGDLVRLLTPEGKLADAVAYGDETSLWPSPPDAPSDGETLARTTFVADGPDSWAIALRPTPGEPNVFPRHEPEESNSDSSGGTPQGGPGTGVSERPHSSELAMGTRSGTPVTWIVVGAAAGASMASILPLVASPRRWRQLMRRVRGRAV